MIIKDFDSIYIPNLPPSYEFVDSVDIMSENFVIIYQTKPEENRFTKGELFYAFIVTHLIKIEDKIKEIFFFSTQTFTTVGYGRINPQGDIANIISSIESLTAQRPLES